MITTWYEGKTINRDLIEQGKDEKEKFYKIYYKEES